MENDPNRDNLLQEKDVDKKSIESEQQGPIQVEDFKKNQGNRMLASFQNILNYFKHLQNILSQQYHEPSQSHISPQMPVELAKILQSIHQDFQHQNTKNQKSIPQSTKYFTLKSHQQSQLTILKSGKFKKCPTFTNSLVIHDVIPLVEGHIIQIQIQLLSYITTVVILNQSHQSPLIKNGKPQASGNFGKVFLVKASNQQIAIKSISFPHLRNKDIDNVRKVSKILYQAFNQYFLSKLFSQLEIGPKVQNINGFDFIIYEDSIEFGLEICGSILENAKLQSQLSMDLLKMHALSIVHRDIKPQNIMYSRKFKKNVLIDFGCSEVISETLGQRTLTTFAGTTAFCSQQVFDLLSKGFGSVDLYHNDLCGLIKSSSILNSVSTRNDKNTQVDGQYKLNKLRNPVLQLIDIKFNLFKENYDMATKLWKATKLEYGGQDEDMQIELIKFMDGSKITAELAHFYWNQIDETIRQIDQFQSLAQCFQGRNIDLVTNVMRQSLRNEHFESLKLILKCVEIDNSQLRRQQKQLQYILLTKQSVEKFLIGVKQRFQSKTLLCFRPKDQNFSEQQLQKQISRICIVVSNYISMAHNRYRCSVDDKVKACSLTMKILKMVDYRKICQFKPVFNCSLLPFCQMCEFYQFYIFFICPQISIESKQREMINSMLTLVLLGLVVKLGELSYYLLGYFFFQIENSRPITNVSQSQRLIKLIILGQFQMILIFKEMYYNPHQLGSYPSFSQQLIELTANFKYSIITLHSNDPLINFNRQFTEMAKFSQLMLDQQTFIYLYQKLISSELIEASKVSKYHRILWNQLSYFLSVFGNSQNFKSTDKVMKHINKSLLFSLCPSDTILPYYFVYELEKINRKHLKQQYFNFMDSIIECKEISMRFQLDMRISAALETKNMNKLNQLVEVVISEVEERCLKPEQMMRYFVNFLQVIQDSLIYTYLQQSTYIGKQFYDVLGGCLSVIQVGMEMGYAHIQLYKRKQNIYYLKIESTELIQIAETFEHAQFYRKYYLNLIKLSEFYSTSIKALKEFSDYPLAAIQQLQPFRKNQLQLLDSLSENSIVFNFIQKLNQLFQSNHQVKKTIKSSPFILTLYLQLPIRLRSDTKQISQTLQTYHQIFQIQTNPIETTHKLLQILPSFEIIFDYLQCRMHNTCFNVRSCSLMIQMFLTFVEQSENFDIIFNKRDLIRCIFDSYVYTYRSQEEIVNFLSKITTWLNLLPTRFNVQIFQSNLKDIVCLCDSCFPRPPKWNPNELKATLQQTISSFKPERNPYMSLVYYNSFRSNEHCPINQRITLYILKSIPYLNKQALERIKPQIQNFVYLSFQWNKYKLYMDLKQLGQEKVQINQFHLEQRELKLHRKYLKNERMKLKWGQNKDMSVKQLVEKMLIKQSYFKDYRYPFFVRAVYVRKVRRYFEVNENHKLSKHMKGLKQIRQKFQKYN